MAIELTQEQLILTSNTLRDGNADEYSGMSSGIFENEILSTQSQPIETNNEYELNKSESLTFLYNLLYDDNSHLTKSDILNILNSLKVREDNLAFSITSLGKTDSQGVIWPSYLKEKFKQDRLRLGNFNWFHNIQGSREKAKKNISINNLETITEFFKFHKFFSKLKLHITHFQLRNLIAMGSDITNGIFYSSSHFHDYNLEAINNYNDDDYHTFFKINRLMPDELDVSRSETTKLDCIIDSRNLQRNSNNRISTLTASNNLLACGTFEGGYILQDISATNNSRLIGEYQLTNNIDGITNHITIKEDKELIVSSNDKSLRIVDINKSSTRLKNLPFASNCSALNPYNKNELIIAGDHLDSFIIDLREPFDLNTSISLKGHKDYGFSCDWSPRDENLQITGNQDGCVRIWDRRMTNDSLHCWRGSLGSSVPIGGPVRNCKFSYHGDYVCWAESLDHVGILEVNDLKASRGNLSRAQSIEFIGKCIGMNFCPAESGHGEQLIIGVNDCPLGGILSYKLESKCKSLDFDFHF